jgi:PIN domain nuclease of toxin-antitoxin system
MIVLDASAVLAYLFGEAGHADVGRHLDGACLSTVNLAEVLGRVAKDGHDPRVVARGISKGGVEIVPFTRAQAAVAASLLSRTRPRGLGLADRACLALAIERRLPVLTADRNWAELPLDVPVHLLR